MRAKPSIDEILAGVKQYGSASEYGRQIGIPARTMRDWYTKALRRINVAAQDQNGNYPAKTYIITSAQISTPVHTGFWKNLKALAEQLDAEILIPTITYNKHCEGDHKGTGNAENKFQSSMFDEHVRPYIFNHRVNLNKKVQLLGNLNILPTAVNPLSGYQTFTGKSSAILPHPKIALESVATAPDKLAKFLVTSGSVTVANYMQKNAGIKGEFHHQIGAVIVEVVSNKQFHLRHVLAEEDGSFYDLTDRYEDGKITSGHRVDSISWGDIHSEDLDLDVCESSWLNSPNCLIDQLKPKHQFFHDLLDFKYRNHHNRDDDLFMKQMNNQSVLGEIKKCVEFIKQSQRDYCASVIVASNHDNAYTRWVKETTHREEPDLGNAVFLLKSQTHLYFSALKGQTVNMFKWACEFIDRKFFSEKYVKFLDQDESYMVNGVECGMHGDKGINGAKGSLKSFAKIGTKCTIGHSHTCGIYEGVYQNGCSRTLQAGYSAGPSSWSHSHTIQYANGKRTILTLINGQYFNRQIKEATID